MGTGSITSPAGAYKPKPTAKGTGYFGFVSKYIKGKVAPQGCAEFYYTGGDFTFYSTSYDWLVVNGATAEFKGSGKINGKGNYAFLISATDGELAGRHVPDTFRIRIWNKTTGERVYDNLLDAPDNANPTTTLKYGLISIQKYDDHDDRR